MQFENLIDERVLSFLVEEDEQYCRVELKGDGPIVGKVAEKIRKPRIGKISAIRTLRDSLKNAGVDISGLSLMTCKRIVETILGE